MNKHPQNYSSYTGFYYFRSFYHVLKNNGSLSQNSRASFLLYCLTKVGLQSYSVCS